MHWKAYLCYKRSQSLCGMKEVLRACKIWTDIKVFYTIWEMLLDAWCFYRMQVNMCFLAWSQTLSTHTHLYIFICMYVRMCVYIYLFKFTCLYLLWQGFRLQVLIVFLNCKGVFSITFSEIFPGFFYGHLRSLAKRPAVKMSKVLCYTWEWPELLRNPFPKATVPFNVSKLLLQTRIWLCNVLKRSYWMLMR